MNVQHARLVDPTGNRVTFTASPNHGGAVKPLLLILHYTASLTTQEAVSWFETPAARASAHLVIGRDGKIVQMVAFDEIAWHAGASEWGTLTDLNRYSIGVEIVDAGKLQRQAGRWVDWKWRVVPDDQVVELTHKLESTPAGWQVYTEAQLESALESALALHAAYSFVDIVGHDDVAPSRKRDPGPAFPLLSFRSKVLGRA